MTGKLQWVATHVGGASILTCGHEVAGVRPRGSAVYCEQCPRPVTMPPDPEQAAMVMVRLSHNMDPTASDRAALMFAQQGDQILTQLRERLAPADYQLVLQLRQVEAQRALAALVARLPDRTLALLGEAIVEG